MKDIPEKTLGARALLGEVKRTIRTNPESFHMAYWERCIAGKICDVIRAAPGLTSDEFNIPARQALGVTSVDAHQLFVLGYWPVEFKDRYARAITLYDVPHLYAVLAELACEYIDAWADAHLPAEPVGVPRELSLAVI